MSAITEEDEPEVLRALLERVQTGAVSIDEAMNFLWLKPVHMLKEVKLSHDLQEALKNQIPSRKAKGRKPSQKVASRRFLMFQAWLLTIEFYDTPPKERAKLAAHFADTYKVDESEVWKYAATPGREFNNMMRKLLGSEYKTWVRKYTIQYMDILDEFF